MEPGCVGEQRERVVREGRGARGEGRGARGERRGARGERRAVSGEWDVVGCAVQGMVDVASSNREIMLGATTRARPHLVLEQVEVAKRRPVRDVAVSTNKILVARRVGVCPDESNDNAEDERK